MDNLFIQRAILSFLSGAGFVLLVTVVAERMGSKIGGIVSGLPGTTMIALVFMGIHHGPEFGAAAAAVSPAVLGGVLFLFVVYASIERLSFWPRLLIAVSVWCLVSYCIGVSGWTQLHQTIPFLLISLVVCYFFLEYCRTIPSAPRISIEYTKAQLAFRAISAGIAVLAALIVSRLAGPVWGGVASTFPVATVASLVILQKTAGLDFTRAMLKTAVVSAACNVGTFVVLVSLTYPRFGVFIGTIISVFGNVISVYFSLLFVRKYVK